MNKLRAILYGTYVILVILLLLMSMRWCCPDEPETTTPPEPPIEEPRDTVPQQEEPRLTEEEQRAVDQSRGIGGQGEMMVTLMWDFYSDIDLHVKQPNGKTISFRKKRDRATGGFLDVDNIVGGRGSAEHIYWQKPPKGNYQVKLNYYSAGRDRGGLCTVVVEQKDQLPQVFHVNMSQVNETKTITIVTVN